MESQFLADASTPRRIFVACRVVDLRRASGLAKYEIADSATYVINTVYEIKTRSDAILEETKATCVFLNNASSLWKNDYDVDFFRSTIDMFGQFTI